MFRGATKVTIDDKGRVVVPAQHREQLSAPAGGRVVVTVDRDQCLRIYAFP
jgi:transcriptional regulator MraZ